MSYQMLKYCEKFCPWKDLFLFQKVIVFSQYSVIWLYIDYVLNFLMLLSDL